MSRSSNDRAVLELSTGTSRDDENHDYEMDDMTSDLNADELTVLGFDIELWSRTKQLPFIRFMDKITFLLGVANFGVIVYFCGTHQWVLPWLYSVKYPLLVFMRWYSYQKQSWHYFLLDFCYYANLLFLGYLWLWYDDYQVFVAVFCIIHGPLLVAVPLFRNSLVFHSIDKNISCYIHLGPALTAFVCRWYLSPSSRFAIHVCKNHEIDDCSVTWTETLGYPALFVCCHSCVYFLMTNVILKKKIKEDTNSLTTYLYLVGGKPNSIQYQVLGVFGDAYRELLFTIAYAMFTILCIVPTVLFYKYFWLNFTYIVIIGLMAVWNGANFYIEVFTRQYEGWGKKLKRKLSLHQGTEIAAQ